MAGGAIHGYHQMGSWLNCSSNYGGIHLQAAPGVSTVSISKFSIVIPMDSSVVTLLSQCLE